MNKVVNPFKDLREAKQLRPRSIAGISPKTIYDLESFKYEILNVRIHEAYYRVFGNAYNADRVREEYQEAKHILRKEISLPPLKNVTFSQWSGGHPLYYYIGFIGLSQKEFCNKVLIREELIKIPKLQKSPELPPILQKVFSECGLKEGDIETLSRMSGLFWEGELPHVPKQSSAVWQILEH